MSAFRLLSGVFHLKLRPEHYARLLACITSLFYVAWHGTLNELQRNEGTEKEVMALCYFLSLFLALSIMLTTDDLRLVLTVSLAAYGCL